MRAGVGDYTQKWDMDATTFQGLHITLHVITHTSCVAMISSAGTLSNFAD